MGLAKEFKLPILGEQGLLRLQAQAFNLINKLNFTPYTFGSQGPGFLDASLDPNRRYTPNIPSGTGTTVTPFSRPASASAGRVIELNARIQF